MATDKTPKHIDTHPDTGEIIRVSDQAERRAIREMACEIARLAADSRCTDVVVLELAGRSPITDYYVIATGTSSLQMKAVADEIAVHFKRAGNRAMNVSGTDAAEPTWILIDFVDVVVHLFEAQWRGYYDLEMLWGDAPRVEDWDTRPARDADDTRNTRNAD